MHDGIRRLAVVVASLVVASLVAAAAAAADLGSGPRRTLAQLPATGQTIKYAPCNAATELTCGGRPNPTADDGSSGVPDPTRPICCNKLNFACGVRSDNGGPRCAICPQVCIFTCGIGYDCTRDPADGCFKCMQKGSGGNGNGGGSGSSSTNSTGSTGGAGSEATGSSSPSPGPQTRPQTSCSASRPCPGGQICAGSVCKADPCAVLRCPAGKACTLTATYAAQCTPVPSPPPASPSCKPACQAGLTCQRVSNKWQCAKPAVKESRSLERAAGRRSLQR
ncbi:hypothetical protein ABPG75_001508 [Micractinium tetrahymenae]